MSFTTMIVLRYNRENDGSQPVIPGERFSLKCLPGHVLQRGLSSYRDVSQITFKIHNRVSRALKIIEIEWKKPNTGWIKVNTDGVANGSPGIASYEAELSSVIIAVEYAIKFHWTNL
ncbi:hypothetical protein TIFTF001_015380 [Ficus carica]|uniref:RNase H type-1 domain-containing protein n=1 Tax=Ficus carica TaxID=3494 RepID=A0AA88AHN7_FICCA|nr:hypothetical protein TIFTF001_015380 [Ficus carica]